MTLDPESLAREVAVQAHAGQVDKLGEPYIGHVERVVARLNDPLDRAVAWLHDVMEDCPEWTPGVSRAVDCNCLVSAELGNQAP